MLDRLIECENRLLAEQRNANDLLAEMKAGKAADELTRMKIEEIQRKIDSLEKQLALMRGAAQQVQGNPQQMPPQGQQFQMPPQMGAQAPQQFQRQAQPLQAGQPQFQTPPQAQPPQMQRISLQAGQPQFQTPPQVQPPQMQRIPPQGYPIPPQTVYQQNAPKKDFEKTFGEAILPICASVLIFISFILFAAIVLPLLNNTVKQILMYAVSIAISLTGGLLLLHDGRNKGFIALAGCGMGALYLSLMLSHIYFRAMGEVALYIGLLLWTAVVCVMSKLRSNSFLIIGQIGVNLSVLLGTYLCSETEDAGKLLFLIIYTIVSEAVFYISHLQKEYNRNIANHIGWCVSLLLLTCGVNEHYLKGTLPGSASAVLLMLVLGTLIVLCATFFKTEEEKSVSFGILNTLYAWNAYALFIYHFAPAEFLVAVIAILVLVLLELRMPGEKHTGKAIFQCALFFQIFFAWTEVDLLKEYVSVALLAAVCLFYGLCRKNIMYKVAGFVYAVLFVIVSMNGFAQLFWCMALAVGGAFLFYVFRDQYSAWMKVTGYLIILASLMVALGRVLSETLWDTWVQNLLVLSALAAVNIVMAKVPALRRNLRNGKEEQGIRIATGIIQILLILYGCGCICLIDEPILHLCAVLIGVVLVCTNSISFVIKEKNEGLSVYAGIKLLVFAMLVLGSYKAPRFLISLAGLMLAAACIVLGFAAGRLLGKNFKGIRIYGLIVLMLCIVKLLLWDIHFDNLLFRAAGLFVSGILCFGISMLYHFVDKRLMGK